MKRVTCFVRPRRTLVLTSKTTRQSVAKQGLQLLQAAEKMASLLGSRAMLDAT